MPAEPQREYDLGSVAQLPLGEGRAFQVGEHQIAVFRTRGGSIYATQAHCPHRGGPLIDGLIGGTILSCPLHAWKFDLRTGEALFGTQGIKTYPVHLTQAGEIVLILDSS